MLDNWDKRKKTLKVSKAYFPGRFCVFANPLRFNFEQQQSNYNAHDQPSVIITLFQILTCHFRSIFPLVCFDLDLWRKQIEGCSYILSLHLSSAAIKPLCLITEVSQRRLINRLIIWNSTQTTRSGASQITTNVVTGPNQFLLYFTVLKLNKLLTRLSSWHARLPINTDAELLNSCLTSKLLRISSLNEVINLNRQAVLN